MVKKYSNGPYRVSSTHLCFIRTFYLTSTAMQTIDNIIILILQMRNVRHRGVKYITCASSLTGQVLEPGFESNLETRALVHRHFRTECSPATNML